MRKQSKNAADGLPAEVLRAEIYRTIIAPIAWLARAIGVGRIPRAFGLALFLVSTPIVVWQYNRPFAYHDPYPPLRLAWWLQPLEFNLSAAIRRPIPGRDQGPGPAPPHAHSHR